MMEQDERRPSETVPFHVAQIIAVALIVGPLIFAGIAYALGQGQPPGLPLLAYMAAGFSAIALILSLIVPEIATRQALRQQGGAEAQLSDNDFFAALQTRVILRSAILDGAAFFDCVAYINTRLWWVLAIVLALLGVMALFFPTPGRFDNWVRLQRELRSLDEQR
jgi:hypothetical protein